MRARPLSKRAAVGILLIAFALTACRGGSETSSDPTTPAPDPNNPAPFALEIDEIALSPMDNSEIVAGTLTEADEKTAHDAVESARVALERYLTAQFTNESTRFTAAPAQALLKPGLFDSLSDEERAVLGVRPLPVTGVLTGPARGTATVLFEEGRAYGVAIEFQARLKVFFAPTDRSEPDTSPSTDSGTDQGHPIVQRGSVLFTSPSWGVESFELTLDAPPPPPQPEPQDVADGSSSPTAKRRR